MRKILTIIPVLLFFSGCRNLPCSNQPLTPYFIGFTPSDIDTLIVRQYKPNESFLHITDTALFINNVNIVYTTLNDTTIVNFNHISGEEKYLLPGYDWQIYIPSINRTVSISDIVSPQTEVSCFKCGCVNPVNSLVVDSKTTIPEKGYVPYFGDKYLVYIKK